MHYLLVTALLFTLTPLRRVRVDVLLIVTAVLVIFSIAYMGGSADYKGYVTYFLCSQNEYCLKSGELNFEKSFVLISNFFYTLMFRSGATWVIGFYSTVALCIKMHIIGKYSRHFGIALLCYVSYAWYVHEMTQIRIGLAIAFYWLAVIKYTKRQNLGSLLFFACALFFHTSTIIGALVYILRYVKFTSRQVFVWCAIGSVVGLAVSGTPTFLSAILSLGFVDPRLATYSDAIGNIVSSTNYLTVYFIANVVLLSLYALCALDEKTNDFEQYGFKLACIGMLYYSFFYWIPTVGLRGFEFFLCFTPFIAAAVYTNTRNTLARLIIVLLCIMVFYNLVVRNGTRTDFVLPGQAQELWAE